MKSMTGYGRAKQELHGRTITAELRAVNHRYLDCTVKAPRQYGFLDDAVKKAAAARIARGKVEVYIGVETQEGGDIAVTVNHAVAEHYLAALHELADKYGLRDDVSVMSLAKLPDVLGSERIEQDADEMTRDVLSVFGEACDNFDEMRTREGAKLAEDVRNRASEIERMVGEVEVRSPERVREYREKLLARMKEVLADTSIDETRIVTEAAIYADKTAVDEETVRLRSHLQQGLAAIPYAGLPACNTHIFFIHNEPVALRRHLLPSAPRQTMCPWRRSWSISRAKLKKSANRFRISSNLQYIEE